MEIDVKQRLRDAIKSQGESISSVSKLIGAKQNTLSRQINTDAPIPLSNILLIIDALGLSPSWLLAGEGDMLKSDVPTAIPDSSGITLYRTEAAAGFGNENFNITEKDIEARYKIKELEAASFMLHVRGDSMTPTYNNGDVIAVQVVRDNRNIQWGKPHLVSSKTDGLLIKRIYDDDGDIIAVSDNATYRPIHIRKDDITGIAIVKGFVRFENY